MDKERDRLTAELHRLEQSRAWSRVREAEAKKANAERTLDLARKEIERQATELRARNGITAAERQELSHLRYEKKTYQEKVKSYEVKKNRKFFEVEPMMEESCCLLCRDEVEV